MDIEMAGDNAQLREKVRHLFDAVYSEGGSF